MKSNLWTLIQYDWCPYNRGKFGYIDTHRGKTMKRHRENINVRTEDWMTHLLVKEHQRLLANHQKLGRGKGGFPYQLQREYGPADTLVSEFCCLKPLSL